MVNTGDITKHIDELLAVPISGHNAFGGAGQLSQGTVSLLALVYGPASPQLESFRTLLEAKQREAQHKMSRCIEIGSAAKGALRNVKRELDAGLIGNVRQQVTGDVLSDFIKLSRTALEQDGDGAKNAAAVLAAAAFEDTIRRMGELLAGVTAQADLADVLLKLKDAGVIQSPQIGIAQSYLNFRNHALHAKWDKIQRESVQSVLGFIEELLLKHFQ